MMGPLNESEILLSFLGEKKKCSFVSTSNLLCVFSLLNVS